MIEEHKGFPLELPVTSITFRVYPTSPEELDKAGLLKLRVHVDPKVGKKLIAVDEEGRVLDLSNWEDERTRALLTVTKWFNPGNDAEHPTNVVKRFFIRQFKDVWKGFWSLPGEEIVHIQKGRRGFRVIINVPASHAWVKALRELIRKEGKKIPYGQHILFVREEPDVWLPVMHSYIRSKGFDIEESTYGDIARHAKNKEEIFRAVKLLQKRSNVLKETLHSIKDILSRASLVHGGEVKSIQTELARLKSQLESYKQHTKRAVLKHQIWYLSAILRSMERAKEPERVIRYQLQKINEDINTVNRLNAILSAILRSNARAIAKIWTFRKKLELDDPYRLSNLLQRLKESSVQQVLRSP